METKARRNITILNNQCPLLNLLEKIRKKSDKLEADNTVLLFLLGLVGLGLPGN